MWQLRIIKGFSLALCLAGLVIVPACSAGFFSPSFLSSQFLSIFSPSPQQASAKPDTLDNAHKLTVTALAQENAGNHDEALKDFDAAIALNALPPQEAARARFNRGVTLDEMGRLNDALADYSEALRLDPKFADALNNRANIYRRMGDLDRAKADYEASLAAGNHSQYLYYGLGQIAEAQGDVPAAQDFYNKALTADPGYRPAGDRLAAMATQTVPPQRLAQTQTRANLTTASYRPDSGPLLRPSILGSVAKSSHAAAAPSAKETQIQLGAYRDEAAANADWNRLVAQANGLLSGLAPQIVPVDLPQKGRFFRLRIAGAPALCGQLKSRGFACLSVKD